jgi:hypothetical protein
MCCTGTPSVGYCYMPFDSPTVSWQLYWYVYSVSFMH